MATVRGPPTGASGSGGSAVVRASHLTDGCPRILGDRGWHDGHLGEVGRLFFGTDRDRFGARRWRHDQRVGRLVGLPSAAPPKPAQVASFRERAGAAFDPPAVDPLTPTTYGIYAVSGDKLFELDLLPGRAPDIRVAISAAIVRPSRTTLPDGHVKFIVYRRDSATYAADRAEIRVIARVGQEKNFDKSGKPVMTKVDDIWVMRNISTPLRTAPKRDNPDMYEVLSEDAQTALAPGRYALVLKGQAYDFNVAGSITDPKQCLERMAATNGQFYSECQKH